MTLAGPISIPLDVGYLHSGEETHQLSYLHLEYDIEDSSSVYLTVTTRPLHRIVGTLRLPNEALDKLAIHWLRSRGYTVTLKGESDATTIFKTVL